MNFKWKVTHEPKRTVLTLSGWIDERVELPILKEPVAGDLVVDLAGIELVNSVGVRSWIIWQKKLRIERSVVLVNCSPVVVKQINILDGFVNDRTKIESILVPYFCEDCGFEEHKPLNIAKMKNPPDLEAAIQLTKCPKCGMNMELDMIKSTYFTFLEKHRAKFNT